MHRGSINLRDFSTTKIIESKKSKNERTKTS